MSLIAPSQPVVAPSNNSGKKRMPGNTRNGGRYDPTAFPHPNTVMIWDLSEVTTCAAIPLAATMFGGFGPHVFIPFSSTLNIS